MDIKLIFGNLKTSSDIFISKIVFYSLTCLNIYMRVFQLTVYQVSPFLMISLNFQEGVLLTI